MSIDFEKIEQKPEKNYKIEGTVLLNYRDTIKAQKNDIDISKKKIAELNREIDDLKRQFKGQVVDLNSEIKNRDEQIQELQETLKIAKNNMEEIEKAAQENAANLENNTKSKEEEISQLKNEIDSLKDTNNDLNSKIEELNSETEKIEAEVNSLSDKNFDLQSQIKNIEDTKDELENKLSGQIDTLDEEKDQLTQKITEMKEQFESEKQEMEDIKGKELEELKNNLNAEFEQKISDMKSQYEEKMENLRIKYEGMKPSEDALKGRLEKVYLKYNGKIFVLINDNTGEGIFLTLDKNNNKWIMSWSEDTKFVERRTAERVARSIAKAGWQSEAGGARYGLGFNLDIQGENFVPDDLLRDQHEYNE